MTNNVKFRILLRNLEQWGVQPPTQLKVFMELNMSLEVVIKSFVSSLKIINLKDSA